MVNHRPPVLLIEDDEQHVYLLQKLIERADPATVLLTFGDAESAIAYLDGSGEYADRDRYPLPRAILLDLQLPTLPGLDLLAWLRSRPDLQHLPVAVVTASRDSAHVARAFELGVNFFLVKPAAFDALIDLMVAFGDTWFGRSDGDGRLDGEEKGEARKPPRSWLDGAE